MATTLTQRREQISTDEVVERSDGTVVIRNVRLAHDHRQYGSELWNVICKGVTVVEVLPSSSASDLIAPSTTSYRAVDGRGGLLVPS
jgi:hypothetical protein